jgi:monoamine oxidase
MEALPEDGEDRAVIDMTDRDSPWTALFDYEVSLDMSHDPDAVSVRDVLAYRKTGEDWPVKEGFGALIVRCFGDLPVTLNAAVERIDWSGPKVRLVTRRGEVNAKKVIITASTGILEGGDIRFDPQLPDWKNEAISSLPLGNHNRIYLIFDRDVFGEEVPGRVAVLDGDGAPISFDIRPFGYNIVHGMTGGRFADWLERAGVEASADFAMQKLREAFGSSITRHVVRHLVTAWRGDPWVKGAYCAARPGQSHQRRMLARPIDDCLYFAGEACSSNSYATAHGAYLSGIEAAEEAAASLT